MNKLDLALRAYPERWRIRYREELVALIEDTYGKDSPSFGATFALALRGIVERFRYCAPSRWGDGERDVISTGVMVTLSGWVALVVAGLVFSKATEHWEGYASGTIKSVANVGYVGVEIASIVSVFFVAVMTCVALPEAWRATRLHKTPKALRATIGAAICGLVMVGAFAILTPWAHYLNASQRNGGSALYSAMWMIAAALVVLTLLASYRAASIWARSVTWSERTLRHAGLVNSALSMTLVVTVAAIATWWGAVASGAPGYFRAGVFGSESSPAPTVLILVGSLAVLGLIMAIAGPIGIGIGRRRTRASSAR